MLRAHPRIDLTRMECKGIEWLRGLGVGVGIDLTRMECKDDMARWYDDGTMYRFNQNGM